MDDPRQDQVPAALDECIRGVVAAASRRSSRMAQLLGLADTDLAAIEHLSAGREVSPTRLAELLDLTSGGVAIVIKRLERGGHVVRRPHPEDARRALLHLSKPTARRYGHLLDRLSSQLTSDLTHASPGSLPALQRLLGILAEHLESQALELDLEVAETRPAPDVPRVPSLWQ